LAASFASIAAACNLVATLFVAFCLSAPALAVVVHRDLTTKVFVAGEGGYHTFRIPAIVVAPNGDVIALCEGRRNGPGDSGDIDLVCRRSTNRGESWGPIEVIWDDSLNTCGNPCPVVDRTTGTIWLPMTHNLGSDHEREIVDGSSDGTRTVWITKSNDDGRTWSRPEEITSACKLPNWTWYATGPGAGIQLERGARRGRLVIPCDHIEASTKLQRSHVIYSDDHGATWQLGGTAPKPRVNECEVVELADGRLLLNMRSFDRSTPSRQIAWSDDGGETWRDQRHDVALVEPVCQASLRRLTWPAGDRPGVLLFANPASKESRSKLTVRVSNDDGQTWPFAHELYPGSSAYSCLVAMPDGSAGCLYEIDKYQAIVFDRFQLK